MYKERFKAVRKYTGLTLDKFGVQAGMGRDAYANLEYGRKEPTELELRAICREFGVSYAWLKTGEGEMLISAEEADIVALTHIMTGDNEFAKIFFRSFARLGAEDWARMRAFMEGVLAETAAIEKQQDKE